jgi:HEAT repeat protein
VIDVGVDREGHSLRQLVWQALKACPTIALFQFLEDRDVIVRSAAARELQLRGGRAAFERARQLLTSRGTTIREMGAFLLGQLGTPKRPYKKKSTKLLLGLLRAESNPVVRATAITSLGQLKAVEALRQITAFSKDRSPAVRGSVAFAIGMVYSERPKEIPSRLEKLLHKLHADKSRGVREQASLGIELVEGIKK